MKTLQIINAKLISRKKEVIRNIFIRDGKILKIDSQFRKAEKTIDAKMNFVIPGVIDPHVHARDFDLAYKEDFFTASKAAAAGGVTTFLDMPNTKPATTTVQLLNRKRNLAKRSIVNYGFHFGGNFTVRNTASNKLFMNVSTGKMVVENKKEVHEFFKNSRLLTVHAEGGKVKEALKLAKIYGTRLYLCHISQKKELDYIKDSNSENIYVEATPHHLFLTKDVERSLGNFAKMKPSLKTGNDQEALWKAIADGKVHTVGTDHAPHTKKEKKSKKFPFGVPGLEFMLPLLLDAVNRGKLSLTDAVRLTSLNPARIFGIKNKGSLAPGFDADLVIVDMQHERKIDDACIHTKCSWSPYTGMKLKGWPIMTIVNGNIVYDKGKFHHIKANEVEFE